MPHYYYRGRRYAKRQSPLKRAVKRVAHRAWDAIQGGHPGGAEAYVERLIEQYPGRPKPPAKAPVDTPAKPPAEAPPEALAKPPAEAPVETPVNTPAETPAEADTKNVAEE
jgi:hypothetical protein